MNMDLDIVQGFYTKQYKKHEHLSDGGLGLHRDAQYLMIRVTDSRVLKLLSRFLLLALFIVSFPSIVRGFFTSSPGTAKAEGGTDLITPELLPLVLHDLKNEGLLKDEKNYVFLSNDNEEENASVLNIVRDNMEIDLTPVTDLERLNSIQSETFDFAWASDLTAATDFLDRAVKINGIFAVELRDHSPSVAFQKPFNYEIVYLRRFIGFDSTIIAMKKSGVGKLNMATQRRLCNYASAKKAALKNLEDVLLEPPRAALGKSSRYLKRTRYLPDLMGDSLENYPRRVFIDVGSVEKGGGTGGTSWFERHYPTRNKDFEMYKIESVTDQESTGKEVPQIGMSDWLRKNVRDEEYVVMKAEAEVVEEMVKKKAIRLVDELFLECKPQPQRQGGKKENNYRSRRAYWECLALYGRLRDEGVAVHQWWG